MLVIDNGDAIRGIAEVASKLDFIVNGYVGTTATQLADGQLGTAEADLYASGADATVVTSITVVNTDTAARTFTLYLKPSGGTSRAISPVSLDLPASYSFYTDGQRVVVLDTSGNIQTSLSSTIDNLSDVVVTSAADHDMLYYDLATTDWVNGTPATILSQLSGQATSDFIFPDDIAAEFGTTSDVVLLNRSTSLTANTTLAGVFVGTPIVPALAANSGIISNVTADGDIVLATQTGGNSQANVFIDASAGSTHILAAGVSQLNIALGRVNIYDDIILQLGTGGDQALLNRTATLTADEELGNVIVGTSVHPATAANSLIISNITTDGDILVLASDGGNSKAAIFFDASAPDLILYNVGGTWTAGATTWAIPAHQWTGMIDQNAQAIGDGTNEILTFGETASAINHIKITNADIGDDPIIAAEGDDTNITMRINAKGLGSLEVMRTLPSTAGQSLTDLNFGIDSSAQVATSQYHAIQVDTTGSPAGVIAALGTSGVVSPIHQNVLTPVTPSQTEFAGRKTTGGTVWADGIDGNEIFIVNSDAIYVGSATQFDEMEVIMGTAATKNVIPTFWYNTAADTWTQFFPTDETEGFQQSGSIIWLLSGISGLWTNDGDPGAGDTTAGYWIKIVRTRISDPGSPTPTTIKIGAATEYEWDSSGAINALSYNGLTVTTTAGTLTIANNASAALVTSGNHSITLTATAATNVTLPTTGTLATLAGTEELDNKTLDSSVAKGTWTASGTWILPNHTSGIITLNTAASLIRNVDNSYLQFAGGVDSNSSAMLFYGKSHATSPGQARLYTPNAALSATLRLLISNAADTVTATWSNITHTGLVLSGVLDANSQNLDNVNSVLDVNSAQVVGTRVVDARCDDAINSGDATTDGVIDALRDAMITHGLIAAA